jgi:hypothetical protein
MDHEDNGALQNLVASGYRAGSRCSSGLCIRHKVCAPLVNIPKDERSSGPTGSGIRLMLTPIVSQISAVTAHPTKPLPALSGMPRPVSR